MRAPAVSLFPPTVRLIGDLTVLGNARISCEVRGKVYVQEHLQVAPNAVVHGDIRSGSLRIAPGAEVKGLLAVGRAATAKVRAGTVPALRRFLSFGRS